MATATVARQSRRRKFTVAFVQAVIRGEHGTAEWRDTESPLKLKRTTTGAQYSVMRFRNGTTVGDRPRDETGAVIKDAACVMPLPKARDWARRAYTHIAEHGTPKKAPKRDTFDALAAEHLALYRTTPTSKTGALPTPNSVTQREYGVRHALSVLGSKSVTDIGPADAKALRDAFPESPSTATKAWIAAKEVLRLAVERGLVELNVFDAMKPPARPKAKDRYPKLDELVRIDQAAAAEGGAGALVVRFLIRLPLRREAAATLRWAEVDLVRRELNLTAEHGRKFKDGQTVPLPALAVELLESIRPAQPDTGALVFPNGGGNPFQGWARLYERLRERSGVKGWSAHDFRRSMVSITADKRPDVSESALDRLLTHAASATNQGVKAVYQRATGLAAQRIAADAWDSILREALGRVECPIGPAGAFADLPADLAQR